MVVKCPALVNYMILGIGLLLVGYVMMNFMGQKPIVYGASKEGFLGSGAGDFCAQNTDCGSNRCGQLDAGKRRCF